MITCIDDINQYIVNYIQDVSIISFSRTSKYAYKIIYNKIKPFYNKIKSQILYNPSIHPITNKRINVKNRFIKYFELKNKYIISPENNRRIIIGNPAYLKLLESYTEAYLLCDRELTDCHGNCIHFFTFSAKCIDHNYSCTRCDIGYNKIYKSCTCKSESHVFYYPDNKCKYCNEFYNFDCKHFFCHYPYAGKDLICRCMYCGISK